MNPKKAFTTIVFFVALTCISIFIYKTVQRQRQFDSKYAYHLPVPSAASEAGDSIPVLTKQSETNPKNHADLNALAAAYFALAKHSGNPSDFDKARDLAKKSIAILPTNNSAAKMLLAKLYESQHEFDKAIEMARQVLAENGNFISAYSTLVYSNLAIGNFKDAQINADKAVILSPSLATVSMRGLALLQSGRESEGVFDLERSLTLEDLGASYESAWARSILARYFLSRGKYSEATFLVNEALKIDPAFSLALDLKAQILAATSSNKEAIENFDRAFSQAHQVVYLRHSAELQAQSNLLTLANERWQQAERLVRADLAGTNMGHRLELAKILIRRKTGKDIVEALELLREEIKIRQSPDTFYALALAQAENNDWSSALSSTLSALATGAKEPEYYFLISRAYENLHQSERSTFYKNLALQLNPEFKPESLLLK